MLEKIQNILLYAGVERLDYERIFPKITRANRAIITIFSGIASVLLVVFYALTFVVKVMEPNRTVYGLGACFAVTLFVFAEFLAKRYPKLVIPLTHIAAAAFYIYGILIGTLVRPEQAAVTFMVMLVFLPILFIDRPIHSIVSIVFYVTIFIVLCYLNKDRSIIPTDVVNSITFSVLGMISGIVVNHMKLRGYVVEQILHEISRSDQMTKMNNRNAYEMERNSIPNYARKNLACVYIDVNDLKYINDTEGHESGDEMLKFVATQITQYFGKQHTYRIGGDEFVAFIVDPTSDWEITQRITELKHTIERQGYNVAVGSSVDRTKGIDIEKLVTQAEVEMYREKELYHEKHGRNRGK